jgi:hypothetical protein
LINLLLLLIVSMSPHFRRPDEMVDRLVLEAGSRAQGANAFLPSKAEAVGGFNTEYVKQGPGIVPALLFCMPASILKGTGGN